MSVAKDGALNIINATPFDWRKIYSHSYQLGSWDLPDEIKSGEIAGVQVDWNLLVGSRDDSAGEATYSFKTDTGHDAEFQVQATYKDGPQIHVEMTNTSTFGNPPPDALLDLVYSKDTTTPFIFSGALEDSFASTNPPHDWMSQNLDSIGCQPLTRLCLPASHNAGMSALGSHTAIATPENTLCHDADVAGQLIAGARWFDIRPMMSNGEFVTGHYSSLSADDPDGLKLPAELPDFITEPISDIANSFQGGNGQSIADVIRQVNEFLKKNHELVILSLSHTMDTDADYRRLSDSQLGDLLKQLQDLEHLWHAPDDASDLTTVPLKDFLKDGPAVLVVLNQNATDEIMSVPKDLQRKGFYTEKDLFVQDQFTGTDDGAKMSGDQIGKMRAFKAGKKKDRTKGLFSLTWTLSPPLGNIRKESENAHQILFSDLWPVVSADGKGDEGVFPNLIMVDGLGMGGDSAIKQGNLAALCMAVNSWVNKDCRIK